VSVTRISVEPGRVRWQHGLLRVQQTRARAGWTRVGLVATTALLLGGDAVEVDVAVGPGACLDLFDAAGTVAYDGRGRPASWRVRISIAAGGTLIWSGEPFVVADGAEVDRSLELDADSTAVVQIRDTLVLGRVGERGGRVGNRMALRVAGRPILLEDQVLDPLGARMLPGVLGSLRVIDSITRLGVSSPDPAPAGTAQFRLLHDSGSVTRFLGAELADSPLSAEFLGSRLSATRSSDLLSRRLS
jgi:urease accessory protein